MSTETPPKEQPKSTESPVEATQHEATESKSLGPFTVSKAFSDLLDTAKPNLSKKQLGFLSQASDEAVICALNMAEITHGLGVLIADDEGKESGRCGYFDGKTSTIIYTMASQFDYLAGLFELGEGARLVLGNQK